MRAWFSVRVISPLDHPAARRALRPITERLDRRIDRRVDRVIRSRVSAVLETETSVLHKELAALTAEVTELRAREREFQAVRFTLDVLVGPRGRRNTRMLNERQFTRLTAEVEAVTGSPDAAARLAQAYRVLIDTEQRGLGRIAGRTANVLGKLTTTPLLAPPNGEVLEIGGLYGLFAAAMSRELSRTGLEPCLTVVDPLADVQLQGRRLKSDVSGSPVTEPVVRANLADAGVDPSRVRLIRGFSGEAETQSQFDDRRYGVVIIDGDHSRDGVAADLVLAERITAPGGIVVVDDYGDDDWPGVTEAVTEHLRTGTRFGLVGNVATSAFLRAHGPADKSPESQD